MNKLKIAALFRIAITSALFIIVYPSISLAVIPEWSAGLTITEGYNPENTDVYSFKFLADIIEDINPVKQQEVNVEAAPCLASPSIASLIKELKEGRDTQTRGDAAYELGERGDSQAVGALITALGNDEDNWVRAVAAEALGNIKSNRAMYPLLRAVQDVEEDSMVRAVAADALGEEKIAWFVRLDANYMIRELTKVLLDRNDDYGVRSAIVVTLGKIRDAQAVDALTEVLNEDVLREEAEYALKMIGNPRLVIPQSRPQPQPEPEPQPVNYRITQLIEELYDQDGHIVETVADELVEIGAEAIEPLIQELNIDRTIFANYTNFAKRKQIAEILLDIKGAMQLLIEALKEDENPSVREGIANVFGVIGDVRVISALITTLEEEDDDAVKRVAISSLENIGAPAVKPLIEVLGDSNYGEAAKDKVKTVLAIMLYCPYVSFIPLADVFLFSDNQRLKEQVADIFFDENIIDVRTKTLNELKNVAQFSDYFFDRAIALYYIGKNYQDEEFLRNYIFSEDANGKLSVKNESISKLEMVAILNTGIPAQAEWWDSLAGRDEKTKYIKLVLLGDSTDQRDYIANDRRWLCVEYAIQLLMNANNSKMSNREAFENYGSGYVVPAAESVYGVPLYYTVSMDSKNEIGHAFNAIYIGEGDLKTDIDINNWILIEPQTDGFKPYTLGDNVKIYLNPTLHKDGVYGSPIIIETDGYSYGAAMWYD